MPAIPYPATVCGRKGAGKIVARIRGSTRKFAKIRRSIVPRIVGIRTVDAFSKTLGKIVTVLPDPNLTVDFSCFTAGSPFS
ncbi:hypothetical protein Q31a_44010 [Aureliella helgolandensis]|uniref:Uncharacterized protein n=1 Tax=Aureliella helgolandensis TaxID=2527968 RepID=A0A518GBN2_9BACT|nr:hypothetical protein Q31a_44010 [Aureliella helgolandensis]